MKKKLLINMLLCLVFFCHVPKETNAQVLTQDSLALVALYDSTNGDGWTDNTNWKTSNSVDTWYGVTVSDNKVIEIDLHSNNLTGVIPVELGNLDSLTVLFLEYNNITGPIPIELGNLTDMLWLNFSGNQLSGTIPSQFGNMINLEMLRIDSNQLTGSIPPELGNLTGLYMLILGWNQLTGTIPDTLGNLTNLQYLWLNVCQLTGTIPNALENLIDLQFLYLEDNQLTGTIPEGLGNIPNLTQLILSNNQLSGDIPDTLGNLTNLTYLDLYHNQLTGGIPDALGALTNLQSLSLSSNQLTGTIPDTLRNLNNLVNLDLRSNHLTGVIPDALGNLTNLRYLYLYSNQLTGTIPDTLGNLTNLVHLRLDNNQLTGAIPDVLANLTNITNFFLSFNQLTGAVPPEIVNLTNLSYFAINNNQLEDFPDLSILSGLNNLTIQDNHFTFEDIEPNVGISTFTYSPQDSVGESKDTTLNVNDFLELSVSVGGTANQYQWVKDGTDITNATDSIYIISTASLSDGGAYNCRITNTIATDLAIYSRTVNVEVIDPSGFLSEEANLPEAYDLFQNYPNPFNPVTKIKFALPEAAEVRIDIHNVLGQKVLTILDEKRPAGYHYISFNAENLVSGVYFYTIQTDNFSKVKKMLLVK